MHRSHRRRQTALVLLLISLLIPTLIGSVSAQTEPKVLRIHQLAYPETADPHKSSFTNEIAMLLLNYEGLTRLDENLNIVPGAAESWEFNEDGTVLTFHLREGLTYSDGSPLTAERFRYAVERTCDPNTAGDYQYILFDIVGCEEFASSLAEAEATPGAEATPVMAPEEAYEAARVALGVTAIDDLTLEIQLTHPAPYFPAIAGLWVFYPAKQELIEAAGEDWWTDPANHVGNGIFQVTGMEQDQLIVYEANEQYWGGRATLDGIELVTVADSSVALEAYNAGELDIMQPDAAQLPAIEEDPTLSQELLKVAGANTFMLTFNMTMEPFTDLKVREAFAYAFDRETWCEVINNGDCVPAYSLIPPGVPGAIETTQYAFDPEMARQALAESSYGGPENLPEITYQYISDFPEERPRAEWIAAQYQEHLGITITIQGVEVNTWVASISSDPAIYPQFTNIGWINDYPDPQNWLSLLWTCGGSWAAPSGYCNPELDELTQQGDQELAMEDRVPFYEQAGQVLLDDAPVVFTGHYANIFLVKPNVSGYDLTAIDVEWPGEWSSMLEIDVSR